MRGRVGDQDWALKFLSSTPTLSQNTKKLSGANPQQYGAASQSSSTFL